MNSPPDAHGRPTSAERAGRAALMSPAVSTPEPHRVETGVPAGPTGPPATRVDLGGHERQEGERQGGGAATPDWEGNPPGVLERLQRAVVRLIERFIRAMRTPKAPWQQA